MRALLRLALALPALLLLAACLHAPEDYEHDEVSRYDIKPLTLTDMEKVIRRAAFIEEWQKVELVEPGHLVATRYEDSPAQGPRKWVATVDILYTPSDFSIHYQSSTNLGYDPYTHIIGHKYQSIVKDLAGRIQDIARVSTSSAKD